jgi:hypothetical protein
MQDRFDYDTYWWLFERLGRTHRPVRFTDVRDGFPADPFFVLRHDVDYSPTAALRLARAEADRGIRATYFLLPNSFYYNLLSPEHGAFPSRLVALGHEVGLHYAVGFFRNFPRERWVELLLQQAALLARLSGTPVHAISMHQPGLDGADPFRGMTGLLNASDDRFVREMVYVSDSCRAWRDHAWEMFASDRFPPRLHLALHPINWSDEDRDRTRIFEDVHDELHHVVEATKQDLLAKIGKHSGVLEHEARLARERRPA